MISRREMVGRMGKAVGATAATPLLQTAVLSCAAAEERPLLNAQAGVDRVTVLPGKTYLRGWAGYGDQAHPERRVPWERPKPTTPVANGPAIAVFWSKSSGPGEVKFEPPTAAVTTATFSAVGDYVLNFMADNGESKSSSTISVSVEPGPPLRQLEAVY